MGAERGRFISLVEANEPDPFPLCVLLAFAALFFGKSAPTDLAIREGIEEEWDKLFPDC
jgi:hypothetical protein